jgi:glycosyltransferase involved in cell wall biosynthesis
MSGRLRIALVTYGLPKGGLARSILRLYNCFERSNYNVEIITTEELGEWFSYFKEIGKSVSNIAYHPLGGPFHIVRVGRRLAKERYDVIFLFHAKYAQAAIRMLPEEVIVMPMIRLDDEQFYGVGTANEFAWNAAVANSEKLRRLTRQRTRNRPVFLIPNGVELPCHEAFSRRVGFDSKLHIIFVGRLSQEKGIYYLPEILRRCLDTGVKCDLRIVGEGAGQNELHSKFRELNLLNEVTFQGAVEPEKVYGFLLCSHILLLPSLFEGLPNVVLEAQACGCVPIASRLEGITDMVINDGDTGVLINVGDVAGFAQGILDLSKDNEKWSRMSLSGHAWISNRFSIDILNNSYNRLVEEAAQGRYALPRARKSLFPIELGLLSWRECIPPSVKTILRPLCVWRRFSKNRQMP